MKFYAFLAAFASCFLVCQDSEADIIKQSTAYNRDFTVWDSTGNNVTGLTSGQFTVKSSKAGAAFTTITPTITEKANGHYNLAYTSGHTDTLGSLALAITAPGAVQTDLNDQVVAYDPNDPAALGLSRLDVAVSTRLATAGYTAPDNTNIANLIAALTPTSGTVSDNLSTTTVIHTGLTSPAADAYKGMQIVFTSGANAGLYGTVSTNTNGATSQLTVLTPFPAIPASGDAFRLRIAISKKDVDLLANALGSDNKILLSANAQTGVTIPTVTTLSSTGQTNLLDQALSGHTTIGTIGGSLSNMDAAITSRAPSTLTASSIATAILLNPANLLKTDSSGNITVGGYASGQDPATLVWGFTIDGTLTAKQMMALGKSVVAGDYAVIRNSTNKTITVTYYRHGTTTVLANLVTTYSDTTLTTAVSRAVTYSNLP